MIIDRPAGNSRAVFIFTDKWYNKEMMYISVVCAEMEKVFGSMENSFVK